MTYNTDSQIIMPDDYKALQSRNILLLDDQEVQRLLLQTVFQDEIRDRKYNFIEARNYDDGLLVAQTDSDLDLAILDHNIGHRMYTGIDVGVYLQDLQPNVKIILHSGDDAEAVKDEAALKGLNFHRYWGKPATTNTQKKSDLEELLF